MVLGMFTGGALGAIGEATGGAFQSPASPATGGEAISGNVRIGGSQDRQTWHEGLMMFLVAAALVMAAVALFRR